MGKGVSVIVPCYNAGDYIAETVESIIAQPNKLPYEIVIADDKSTDVKTLRELARLEEKYPQIVKVIHCDVNGGTAAARNAALRRASYRDILALDSDDKLSTDPKVLRNGTYMDRGAELLDSNPDVVIAYARAHRFEAAEHRYNSWDRYDEKAHLSACATCSYVMFRRDEALAIGGYNKNVSFGEDWDFSIAMVNERRKNGQEAKVHRFEEAHVMYRVRANHSSKTDTNKIPVKVEIAEITHRSPEIFAIHYPGLQGSALVDAVYENRNSGKLDTLKGIVRDFIEHPVGAFNAGAHSFVAHRVSRQLAKLWHRAADQVPEAERNPGEAPIPHA